MKDMHDEFERMHEELARAAEEIQQAGEDIAQSVSAGLGDFGLSGFGKEIAAGIRGELGGEEGDESETVDQQFSVAPRPELWVKNVSGDIAISTGEPGTITVHAVKHGSRRRMANTRIEHQVEGNRVVVRTRGDASGFAGVRGNVSSVSYRITVPPDCAVQVEAVSADVRVQGMQASVQAQTVSGDLTVLDITGDCSFGTVSGDIRAERIVGDLSLRTTSGDATLLTSRLPRFNLSTVSGDMTIETPLIAGGHYQAKTVSGDLRIRVSPDSGATIQLKTLSGDVQIDRGLQAQIIKAGRRSWQGRLGNGAAHLEMNSVSGDLRIGLAGSTPTPPMPPMPPMPAPQAETPTGDDSSAPAPAPEPVSPPHEGAQPTTEILRRLAQGEITVEEAMAQLDQLGR